MSVIRNNKKLVALMLTLALTISMAVPVLAAVEPRSTLPVFYVGRAIRIKSYASPDLYLTAPTMASNYRVYALPKNYTDNQVWKISYYTSPNHNEYLLKMYSNQNICMNIAGDNGCLVYSVTAGTVEDKVIRFADEGNDKFGIILVRHNPMVAITLSNVRYSSGYRAEWQVGGAAGQQNNQFWLFETT